MIMRRWLAVLILTALGFGIAALVTAIPVSATPGQLGGMDIAGYCSGLGDNGNGGGNTALLKGGITGPNYAYGNWACVNNAGGTVPIATTGPAPSMTDVCHVQYLNVASYAYPTDPNDAYTWNCYLLPPASGAGVGQQAAAAVNALFSTDQVQAEITLLQSQNLSPNAVESQLRLFLSSTSMQELIADVLGGYGLPNQQPSVTERLRVAMAKAILHQP